MYGWKFREGSFDILPAVPRKQDHLLLTPENPGVLFLPINMHAAKVILIRVGKLQTQLLSGGMYFNDSRPGQNTEPHLGQNLRR